ncbi:hypothetical protein C8R44DRAFT_653651 [Mycena epipterygia]|nr:hypothetical protein C8R44DRAFT_653651 [Mycena epipterygia]
MDNIDLHYTSQGFNLDDFDLDNADGFVSLPPGEEGVLHSHAGGEVIFSTIMDDVLPGRSDPRVRSNWVQLQINAWTHQIPHLTDAYLAFKAEGPVDVDHDIAWSLTSLSFSESGLQTFSHPPGSSRISESLLRYGYIVCSPEQPILAVSIHLLEVYHQQHRVCPRFSLDALAKSLNHLHNIPRKPYLGKQISIVYDTYVAIMQEVDRRVNVALKRKDGWYMENVCPPCLYKMVGEPTLNYSFLAAMDGNSSLQLVDSTFQSGVPRVDDRKSMSARWISSQDVDKFKDEVSNAQKKVPTNSASASDGPDADGPDADDEDNGDVAWLNINELQAAEITELENCINACVERWRAAGPEACKKMFQLFAISGIFLAMCRHGHVLVMCDMI